jgi:pimeloyl-ACP methyl ester carboxylesterase
MIQRGSGPPLVFIPGIVGRWEWLERAVEALAASHRVLTFSLNDVHGPRIFDRWSDHVDQLLDSVPCETTPILGVSFGGLVAAYYAATRPRRVSRLILVSTPAPGWRIDNRTARLARRPRLLFPIFAWHAVRQLRPEISAALPSATARIALAAYHTARALTCPLSPSRMAGWAREWAETDLETPISTIRTPTLVLTGEAALDRVVPVASSLEYLSRIPGSTHVVLERTGHLGFATRPHEFARLVAHFTLGSSTERATDSPRPSWSA